MPFSTLIVYQPLESFGEDLEYWKKYVEFYENYWGGPTSPFGMWFGNEYNSFKKALSDHIGIDVDKISDCLFMKNENNNYFVAPINDSSNLFSSENIVPLEWFILFSEDERKNFFSHWGFNSIHYDTTLSLSAKRIENCNKIISDNKLMELLGNNPLKPFLSDLSSSLVNLDNWMNQFNSDSNLILNYGDICTYIQPQTLKYENSVNDLYTIIELIKNKKFNEAELNLKIFFQKWDDIRNKCMGNVDNVTIQ
ncbi:MAG: hypothetical protein GTO02_04420 [Candidatus Dadabacteria bacterium]|nr:hypothetical protein [Candidatus Dadabacteria bacterium]NIQ13665.1 hypothetical protein [Candidatus Dadabacteria bacterium]